MKLHTAPDKLNGLMEAFQLLEITLISLLKSSWVIRDVVVQIRNQYSGNFLLPKFQFLVQA